MIEDFLSSFDLFGDIYIAGASVAALLSILGIFIYSRNQLFSGIAIAQAATLGVAFTLVYQMSSDLMIIIAAVIASLTMNIADHTRSQNGEKIAAWIFLAATSFTVILVANSPHSLNEVKQLMSSSLLGSTRGEAIFFWLFLAAVIVLVFKFYKKIVLFMIDREMALSVGMNPILWIFFISLILGFGIGLSLKSTGMIFTFAYLVLPPMLASTIVNKTSLVFILSPMIGFGSALISFVLANSFDLPLGQAAVGFLCVLLVITKILNFLFIKSKT